MKPSRLRTLLIGLGAGVAYGFLAMLVVLANEDGVSVGYIYVLPLVLGAVPVLFSTREQLQAYKDYILLPWGIVLTVFFLSYISGFEGLICLVIIIGPFLLLGSLGALLFRFIKLRDAGNGTRLYASLLLPFLALLVEKAIHPVDQFHTVTTSVYVDASRAQVWSNVQNVRHIRPGEITTHFVHLMGVPKPLDGALDYPGAGGVRRITWEKGIRFQERITAWHDSTGFAYDIDVDPASIPPTTLDEHVMIGGEYFDVVRGSYSLAPAGPGRCRVTLTCTYRVTTNLPTYSRWWADFVLDDFNTMILEVIKRRSEQVVS
ncbi:SRPBCC family protein [Hymenobacter negativus]|uniref:SRPBCC family protein n=1 Tax=Hymenobacter negativus TaxID=2795026 RepID=A0ABS3QA13_9BACT|nr:SRPBCC family protein [Hymenobacter negativus]MBO2008089.1 SRPBCC family protein [Hymenobacter negativus]